MYVYLMYPLTGHIKLSYLYIPLFQPYTCTPPHTHAPFFSLSKLYVLSSVFTHTHYAPNTCPPPHPPHTHTQVSNPPHSPGSQQCQEVRLKRPRLQQQVKYLQSNRPALLVLHFDRPCPQGGDVSPAPAAAGPRPTGGAQPCTHSRHSRVCGKRDRHAGHWGHPKSQPSTVNPDSPADEHFSLRCLPANNLNYPGGNAHYLEEHAQAHSSTTLYAVFAGSIILVLM